MDRTIVYPGSIPLDTDMLSVNRNAMIALGALAQATLGTGTVVDGLVCTTTSPAGMSVIVGPGSITTLSVVDNEAYGSLPADITDPLVKTGVNLASTTFTLTAPTTSGQSINYLIQASFEEADADPVVLPYYNAGNPAQPFSGPANAGTAQPTARLQSVQLQLKAGAAANAGTQTTPAVDSGWVGLYAITVSYGQSAIGAGSINQIATAPFIPFKLPQLAPGVSRMAVISANQTWTVPAGVTLLRLRCWGGGGAGGAGNGGAGGGGAGAGYSEGYYAVVPGTPLAVVIGAGGVHGASSGAGGTTSLSAAGLSLPSATGGTGGGDGGANTSGVGASAVGAGFGTGILVNGAQGQDGIVYGTGIFQSGGGGGGFASQGAPGCGGNGTNITGKASTSQGAAGAGGVGTGTGGNGGPGLVVIEW